MSNLRIGYGTDVHPLKPGNELVLGGVSIDSDRGTSGHSDGDALIHAFIDSLLGACGWDDIGEYFPNTDRWENANSLNMLEETVQQIKSNDITLINSDLTVHCEKPRLGSYRENMQRNCQKYFSGTPQVNVKFKTADGLGPIGEGDAVRADAVSLVEI
jgi:2-C-methyl-D-erythritol 2,4-cyclodiphosphate synthase